jgi:hypothetical protein
MIRGFALPPPVVAAAGWRLADVSDELGWTVDPLWPRRIEIRPLLKHQIYS